MFVPNDILIEILSFLPFGISVHISPKAAKYSARTEKTWLEAARKGDFTAIKWLLANDPIPPGCAHFMDEVATFGHLKLLKYLHNRKISCSTWAMDGAARNGHLEIVKFLNENRTEGCTKRAMDSACLNGNFEIVEYLALNRREGCGFLAMSRAARNGHFKIVKFLYEKYGSEVWIDFSIEVAKKFGHNTIVKYLEYVNK